MTEVLIVGGGTAGAVAGIAATRRGARTLIVEPLSFLGGTQTGALVSPMMPNHLGGEPMTSPLNEEILDRLEATGDTAGTAGNRGWFNPEMLKCVLDDMVAEAGCDVLFQTVFESAVVEDGIITGATVVNKGGRQELRAARVVDATGDADVAVSAGCPFESGGPGGARQAISLRWLAGGVDLLRFCEWLDARGGHGFRPPIIHYMSIWGRNEPLEPVLEAAVRDGLLERADGDFFQMFSVPGRPGEVAFNCPRLPGRRDGADPWDLSRAHIEGRRAIRRLLAFCRARLPGFEDAYISQIAPMAGVRESRRIVGEYTLTTDDCAAARKFPDAVARCNYPLDIHDPDRPGGRYQQKLAPGEWYEVPYRCLLPLGVENLLVAGRCISADFEAQSSVRIQAPVRAMGEAAGLAAAISVENGISPRALDARLVRAAMGWIE
jgi:hypothetical protein